VLTGNITALLSELQTDIFSESSIWCKSQQLAWKHMQVSSLSVSVYSEPILEEIESEVMVDCTVLYSAYLPWSASDKHISTFEWIRHSETNSTQNVKLDLRMSIINMYKVLWKVNGNVLSSRSGVGLGWFTPPFIQCHQAPPCLAVLPNLAPPEARHDVPGIHYDQRGGSPISVPS
jgi:hypothetical protein